MAYCKAPTSSVQVRFSFDVAERIWHFSVEIYKGNKTYACDGCAVSRQHAEQQADEFAAMILNPTEACA